MRLRCGGIVNDRYIANFLEIVTVKVTERFFLNRPIFDEVMCRAFGVHFFCPTLYVFSFTHLHSHCVCCKVTGFQVLIVLEQLISYLPRIHLHTKNTYHYQYYISYEVRNLRRRHIKLYLACFFSYKIQQKA